MTTQMGEDTLTIPETQVSEPGDHEKFAHYVDKDELMEATVNGTPCTALCGKKWVPTRDAQKFPVCPECAELIELTIDDREDTD